MGLPEVIWELQFCILISNLASVSNHFPTDSIFCRSPDWALGSGHTKGNKAARGWGGQMPKLCPMGLFSGVNNRGVTTLVVSWLSSPIHKMMSLKRTGETQRCGDQLLEQRIFFGGELSDLCSA